MLIGNFTQEPDAARYLDHLRGMITKPQILAFIDLPVMSVG